MTSGNNLMAKKQNIDSALKTLQTNSNELERAYQHDIATNPEYSLDVDPTNKYNLDEQTKIFIDSYIQLRSISSAATMAQIEKDAARELFLTYPVQQEIRRINKALYHRQFSKKMLDLDQLGGYLSSLIEDYDMPMADRLSSKDKLSVVRMLIDLNQLKIASMGNPSVLMTQDISSTLKNLSIGAIKSLLEQNEKTDNKEIILKENARRTQSGDPILTPEESAYLDSLSPDEAAYLLNEQYKE